jgi:hypothetical protein
LQNELYVTVLGRDKTPHLEEVLSLASFSKGYNMMFRTPHTTETNPKLKTNKIGVKGVNSINPWLPTKYHSGRGTNETTTKMATSLGNVVLVNLAILCPTLGTRPKIHQVNPKPSGKKKAKSFLHTLNIQHL